MEEIFNMFSYVSLQRAQIDLGDLIQTVHFALLAEYLVELGNHFIGVFSYTKEPIETVEVVAYITKQSWNLIRPLRVIILDLFVVISFSVTWRVGYMNYNSCSLN